MKFFSKRHVVKSAANTVAVAALACLAGATLVRGQAPADPKPLMAEEVFKNVQVLKGIPADEFLGTMGVFSAALGISCEDCHKADDSKWENLAVDNPIKRRARGMVAMMTAINKNYFGGRQVVTCYTCHRGNEEPRVTSSLVRLYGTTPAEEPVTVIAPAPNAPPAERILDKYIAAIGGAQKVAALSSISAKGTNSGYGPEGGKRALEFYARSPAQRTTIVHTDNGDTTTTFDGRNGWYAAPLRPVPVLPFTGQSLEGVKVDAELTFPAGIGKLLTNMKVGFPATIGDKDYAVVQGVSAGGTLTTLYFDQDSGLLTRMMRYANTPVGRLVTQYDYSDYREAAGVKIPFKWTETWLDGREDFELTEVQANVAIDASKFAKPGPPVAPKK
jgi:photosynthetic reaction center cytochrome c subunit